VALLARNGDASLCGRELGARAARFAAGHGLAALHGLPETGAQPLAKKPVAPVVNTPASKSESGSHTTGTAETPTRTAGIYD
jgi:hypothetical protein